MIAAIAERPTTLPTRHHLYLLTVAALVEAANRLGSPRGIDRLARGLASLAYRLSREKRRRAERSVTELLGAMPDAERDRIVRGAFHTFWDDTLSFVPWRGSVPPEPEVVGVPHLQAALAAGKGVVLWESGYFGRRNIAKQVLHHHGFGLHQVHHETHRAGFVGDPRSGWVRDRLVLAYFTAREREFLASVITLPHSESLAFTRTLLATLERNQIVCITADVAHGQRLVAVPLFGRPKRFATGMVTLARTCGATLLPLFCFRGADGRLRVIIEPAIPVASTGDRDEAIAAPLRHYAGLLESYIRRHPDQYRSWHYPWWSTA